MHVYNTCYIRVDIIGLMLDLIVTICDLSDTARLAQMYFVIDYHVTLTVMKDGRLFVPNEVTTQLHCANTSSVNYVFSTPVVVVAPSATISAWTPIGRVDTVAATQSINYVKVTHSI